jgi:hypothetical protein
VILALAARVSSLKEAQNEPPDLKGRARARDQARISPCGLESERNFFPHCAHRFYMQPLGVDSSNVN